MVVKNENREKRLLIEGTIKETDQKIFDLQIPTTYSKDSSLEIMTEKDITIPKIAKYSNQIITTDGLCIIEANMYAQKDIEGFLNVNLPSILLTFHFEKKPEIAQKFAISGNIEVHFDKQFRHRLWLGEKESNYVISIIFSRDYYLKLCKENEWIQHFPLYQAVLNNNSYHSTEKQFQLNVALKTILGKLLINPYGGLLKKLYIDTKMKSLLATLSEQEYVAENATTPILFDETTERLYQAKQILENNIQNPPTIKSLSRMVLLNEMKLKQGFKDLFGTTIRNYVIKLRMETAHNMMTHENTLIFEVAMRLGYKDTSHFINAFKTYFGYTPKYFCTNIRQTLKLLFPFYFIFQSLLEVLEFSLVLL